MLCLCGSPAFSQTITAPQDEIVQLTQDWLKAISTGDGIVLNRVMDSRCIITTPAGDILNKDRLVPDDEKQGVQRLPLSELVSPLVRIYGDTAVLMAHLEIAGKGPGSVATFIFGKQAASWKLVGLHISATR
jgi:ketosteroid isomerase-like protein